MAKSSIDIYIFQWKYKKYRDKLVMENDFNTSDTSDFYQQEENTENFSRLGYSFTHCDRFNSKTAT